MALVVTFPLRGAGTGRGPLLAVVILEPENLERMRNGDPYNVRPESLEDFSGHAIGQLNLVIAYEEDKEAIMKFRDEGDRDGLIAYLERGRVHQPGDAGPPETT